MTSDASNRIIFYGLSTCIHCKHIHDFLDDRQVDYTCIYVDLLEGEERSTSMQAVKKHNPKLSFPTVVIDERTVIVGEAKDALAEALDTMEDTPKKQDPTDCAGQDCFTETPEVEKILALLRPIQEKKGYFFNADELVTKGLVANLILIKQKWGQMICPCRLHNGTYENYRDIICPCVYRVQDVAEYGTCYCGLYVSEALKDTPLPNTGVPERRPLEKLEW